MNLIRSDCSFYYVRSFIFYKKKEKKKKNGISKPQLKPKSFLWFWIGKMYSPYASTQASCNTLLQHGLFEACECELLLVCYHLLPVRLTVENESTYVGIPSYFIQCLAVFGYMIQAQPYQDLQNIQICFSRKNI